MTGRSDTEQLRQRFVSKAEAVFDAVMARVEVAEEVDLTAIEEIVDEVRTELTGTLVESVIELRAKEQPGPGPKCASCGREMRYKGRKGRTVLTSQGGIKVKRAHYYCERCEVGFFPPGSPVEDRSPGLE